MSSFYWCGKAEYMHKVTAKFAQHLFSKIKSNLVTALRTILFLIYMSGFVWNTEVSAWIGWLKDPI